MKQVALVLLAATLLVSCGPKKMTQEAIDYAKSIEFDNARMSVPLQTYSRQTVYYLRIDVKNHGSRAVKQMEVVLFFYDAQGKVVSTERATAVSERLKPLGPGETRDFRHGFDFPSDWNRVTPTIRIAYMELK